MTDFGKTTVNLLVSTKNLDPESFTEAVGINPDFSWKRGQPRRHSIGRYENGGWGLESPLAACADASPVVKELLARLNGKEENFVRGVRSQNAEALLTVVVYAGSGFPALVFPVPLLDRIARLNLELQLDLYAAD